MNKVMMFIVVFISTALVSTGAYAVTGTTTYKKNVTQMDRKKRGMDKLMKELGLTDKQKKKLKEMKTANIKERQEISEKIMAKRKEMVEELNKPDSNERKLNGLVNDITALNKKKIQARVKSVLDMKKVLTPEQYRTLNEKFRARMEARRKYLREKLQEKKKKTEQKTAK